MRNRGLKALSLLIAVLLFSFVNSESNTSTAKIFVGVELKDTPPNKIAIWQLQKQIEVEIRGPSFQVSRIAATPPSFRIRIPYDADTQYVAKLNKSDLPIQPPVQVVSIEPSRIEIALDNKVSKEVPVRVAKLGKLSEDLRLDDIKVTPATVTVTGPESEIKEIQSVQTAPVNLGEIVDSKEFEYSLPAPGKYSQISANFVKVNVVVSFVKTKRQFTSLAVEVRTAPGQSYTVDPTSVAVEVIGSRDVVNGLKTDSIIPYVRVLKEDKEENVKVTVDPPEDVTVLSIAPESVRVSPVVKRTEKKK